MSNREALIVMVVLLFGLFPSLVRAEPQPAPESSLRFTYRPLSINFVLGFATPTGEIGGAVEYNLASRFATGVGVGLSPFGTQVAASARLRLGLYEGPGVAHGFDLVGAFATGSYGWWKNGGDDGEWKERAYWVQGGLDYEVLRPGFRFATGMGVAVLAGSSNVQRSCTDYCPHAPQSVWPTMHITLGFGI